MWSVSVETRTFPTNHFFDTTNSTASDSLWIDILSIWNGKKFISSTFGRGRQTFAPSFTPRAVLYSILRHPKRRFYLKVLGFQRVITCFLTPITDGWHANSMKVMRQLHRIATCVYYRVCNTSARWRCNRMWATESSHWLSVVTWPHRRHGDLRRP